MPKNSLTVIVRFLVVLMLSASCARTTGPAAHGGSSGSGGAAGGGGSAGGGPGVGGAGGNRPPLPEVIENPPTCEGAATYKSYVGCEFWPTVTYNPVYEVFDFAVVVANPNAEPAQVTVSRAGQTISMSTVQPHSLQKIILPWVKELKGMQFNAATAMARPTASVRVDAGAYKLTSTVPVTAWQFNPLQYRKAAGVCPFPPTVSNSDGMNCESVAADAALLIPAAAMTGN
jgi:hypothetical protein